MVRSCNGMIGGFGATNAAMAETPPNTRRKPESILLTPPPIWFGVIFAIGGLFFSAYGGVLAARQRHMLMTYVPTSARVSSASVQTHTDSHGTETYSPDIRYVYSVNGVNHQSNQAGPLSTSESGSWAARVVARYPPGTVTTAWYDPSDPSKAFLLHEPDFVPYILLLFPSVFIAAGIGTMMVSIKARRPMKPPITIDGQWFRVAESGTLRGKVRICAIAGFAFYLYAGLVLGHYHCMSGVIDMFTRIAGIAAIVAGLVFPIQLWRYWRLQHDFLDADLRIAPSCPKPGDNFKFMLRQELIRPLEVEQMSVGLVCIRESKPKARWGAQYDSVVAWSLWKDLDVNRSYRAGDHIDVKGEIALPARAHPSSGHGSRENPRFIDGTWKWA